MSNNYENFAEEFMTNLEGDLSVDQMRIVLAKLQMYSSNFNIEEKCTDLMIPDDIIPGFYKTFIVSKKIEGMSPKSIITYDCNLKDFFYNINKPIEEIDTNDVRRYLFEVQQRREISNRTLDGKRLILNSFFDWSYKEGYLKANPVARIAPIKFEQKERQPLNDYELEMVRTACKNTRDRAMIEFFAATGARVSEVEILKRKDINMMTKEVRLFGKGSKHRTTYINARAKFWLEKYWLELKEKGLEDEEYVFYTMRKPFVNCKKECMEARIHNIGIWANLGRPLFPHLLRHTFASGALRHGIPLVDLQRLLGHTKADTTLIYAKLADEEIKYNHQKYVY